MDNSKYCKIVMIASIFLSVLYVGYQFTCLNPLVPVLDAMYNQTYIKRYGKPASTSLLDLLRSLTFSMFLMGAFFGAVTFNVVFRFLTRKQAMIGIHLIAITGTLIIALGARLTGSYEAFITGRFVIGYAVGCHIINIGLVIGETGLFRYQSFYNGLIGTAITFGDFIGPCIAHPKVLGNADLWPVMISFTMIPSVFYLCCVMWIPETPYQVLRMHGREKAKELLRKLRVAEENENFEDALNAEIEMMECEQNGKDKSEEEVDSKKTYVGIKEILLTKQYRMQLFGVVALYAFQMLSGINNALFYSDEIFRQVGIPDDKVTFATIGGAAMLVVGSVTGIYLVSRFGEKKTILGMALIICLALILLTTSLATVHLRPAMSYISVVGVMLMFYGFAAGPNLIISPLAVAMTTEPTRPIIFPIAGAALWLSGWFVGFLPPYLQVAMGPYGLLLWLGFSVLFIAYCVFFIPNPKGKTSEEIQRELNGRRKKRSLYFASIHSERASTEI